MYISPKFSRHLYEASKFKLEKMKNSKASIVSRTKLFASGLFYTNLIFG